MSCHDTVGRLDDYVDGVLPEEQAGAVRAHIASCASCRGGVEELERLLEQTAALPRTLEPERDLWSGIADRIAQHPGADSRSWWRLGWAQTMGAAAAAILAAAVILGLVAGGRREVVNVVENEPADLSAAALNAVVALGSGDAEFERARVDLLAVFEERRQNLSPETAGVIAGSLRALDGSIQGIRGALEANPENPRLVRMLTSAYQREIDLLRRAARLPDGV